jgi:hypothetical protein
MGKVGTLRLALVAGNDPVVAQRAGIDASSFGLADVDDTFFLVTSGGV